MTAGNFIDAAFAFAISMLVIAAQRIPDNIRRSWRHSKCADLCLQHRRARHLLAGPLVVEPALRPRRRHFDFDQLGDDRYDPDLIYPLKAISDVGTPSEQWPGRPAVLASHHRIAGGRSRFLRSAVTISAEILLLNLRAWQLREPLRLNAREDW
jgi:hypothetical protein